MSVQEILTLGQARLWCYFSNVVAVVVPREERQVGAHGVVIAGAELLLNCGGGLPVSEVKHWWNS